MSIGVLHWETGGYLNPCDKGKSFTFLYCISQFFSLLCQHSIKIVIRRNHPHDLSWGKGDERWSTSSCQGLLLSSSHLRWCWKAAETFCQKNGALQAGVGSKLPLFRLALSEILSQIAAIIPPFRDRGAAVEKSGIPHFIKKKNSKLCQVWAKISYELKYHRDTWIYNL